MVKNGFPHNKFNGIIYPIFSLTVQASHQYHQEVSRAGGESGGAERAAGRHGKARLAMEGAEESYRVAVEGVEEVRATWRRETEGCAGVFQVRTRSEAVEPGERFYCPNNTISNIL